MIAAASSILTKAILNYNIANKNKMLKLSITENNEYLRFIAETGDTLSTQTNEIQKPYSVFNKKKSK